MKNSSGFIKKHLTEITLLVNALVSYHKLYFFADSISNVGWIYLLGLVAILLLAYILPSYKVAILRLVLLAHLIFHGLFSLSLPIGMVFALIGSYYLAGKIFLIFYLPSFLAVFLAYKAFINLKSNKEA